MKNHKNINEDDIDLKNIFNIINIANSIISQVKNYFSRNKSLHNGLLNLYYENDNISNYIQVKFKRKNKEYMKNIYFYITKTMSKNLENSNKMSQWFMDCTYYAIPRNNNQFKLFIIIGNNQEEKKQILGTNTDKK